VSHEVAIETRPALVMQERPRFRWACTCAPGARGHWTTDLSAARAGGSQHARLAPASPADIAVEEHW